MKVRFCGAVLLLFVFAGFCFAQVPVPSLPSSVPKTDFSLALIVPEKDSSLSHWGEGEQFTLSHFFYQNIGLQAEADFEKINYENVREGAVRVGPIVRFKHTGPVQPYIHALGGITDIRTSYLKPVNQYNTAGSILVGGGFDIPLSRGFRPASWYVRAGVDVEYDSTTVATKAARGTIGVSYRFGANGVCY